MLRGAVVGYGFISENGHLPAYEASRDLGMPIRIVALADVCPARLMRAHARYPGLRLYQNVGSLLSSERELDFVDISTPPSEHAWIAHAALSRGLHVFCEKPLATSGHAALAMIEHARRAQRVLFPSHNYKHAPVVKAVRKVLDDGLLGRIRLLTLQTFRNTHAKGVPEWRPDWRREHRYSGGGIAMDHGSHTFYLAFDWLGGLPLSVTAKASTFGPFDTEDDFSCTMTFPEAIASAHLTWNAGVRKVVYTLHGEGGALRVEDDDVELSVMKASGDGRTGWDVRRQRVASHWMDASHAEWFCSVFRDFSAAIEGDDYAGRETIASFKCIELIETAYASARMNSTELPLRDRARRPAMDSWPHRDPA